ncbi:hybrid sensor histidine kinase/response regulator [Paenibacillus bouchesdurhonensis]|uniref:hybrid sensor histidine kinase/response regulator n=1 Tax=Paenibacillus bouchesdurhonensis TaxID=1870990 RepID=UPI001F3F4E5D|nr:ATP-binding protein [Paenibacillus bouchesdurhonensis]
MRNWSPLAKHTVKLDGEWIFYPHTFLMQSSDNSTPIEHTVDYISVPDSWKFPKEQGVNPYYGFGSYRLRILVDPNQGKSFGFHITSITASSKVYVNGQLIGQTGQPAEHKGAYEPLDLPFTAYYTLENENVLDLVIQVANFDNIRTGGLNRPIKFGLENTLDREIHFVRDMIRFACIAYMIHALYGVVLFFIGSRDKRLLYFSGMITCIVLGTLLDGERLLLVWLPFNYEWSIKILFITIISGGYFLVQTIRHRLPYWLRTTGSLLYIIACMASMLIVLLLPVSYSLVLQPFYILLMFIPCLLAPAVMFGSTIKNSKENIFLLLAAIAAISSLIWLFILYTLRIEMVSYPFDLIIATICFAAYWFKRYFQIIDDSQMLARKLQRADKHKDDFLATVAHELRNPLHGILNISQSVSEREKNTLGDKSAKDLDLLVTVGQHMSFMLNELLDLGRLKENRIKLQPAPVSIHSLTAAVIDMLQFMTEGKPLQFSNRIPSDFPLVMADENRLIQILFNLLHNAVKYSYAGEVSVHASAANGWATISVADSGIGMETEVLKRIFEPYEQAVQGITALGGGFGLGLSICKQLVEMHGGTMTANSKAGEGSVFAFTLKIAESSKAAHEPISLPVSNAFQVSSTSESAATLEPISDRVRLLAVDDDPVNLKVLESIFATEPYEVITATSGQDALSKLDRCTFDLVISDVMMPNMSGYELTSRVRERYSLSELPVLLLTAYSRDEDIEAGFRAGANDYVTKPMKATELKSRVKSLTKLKKSVNDRLRMEAAWLQAQIKPHFILNTFTAIAELSRVDMERMDALVEELNHFIRLSIDFQNSDQAASLEHELSLVQSYLYIQKERFGGRLQVIWEVDDSIQIFIPPLTIQPLVENAVIHGVLKRSAGGEVRIGITQNEYEVEVRISDNGIGIANDRLQTILERQINHRTGIGLHNTDRRLKQLYGSGLKIDSKLGEGTTVSFSIRK